MVDNPERSEIKECPYKSKGKDDLRHEQLEKLGNKYDCSICERRDLECPLYRDWFIDEMLKEVWKAFDKKSNIPITSDSIGYDSDLGPD